jgi:hypothetical protein
LAHESFQIVISKLSKCFLTKYLLAKPSFLHEKETSKFDPLKVKSVKYRYFLLALTFYCIKSKKSKQVCVVREMHDADEKQFCIAAKKFPGDAFFSITKKGRKGIDSEATASDDFLNCVS